MGCENKTHYPKVYFMFDGIAYRWCGWFGCQLESYEWLTHPAGTMRRLDFGAGKPTIELTVFSTKREGLKVRTTWAVSDHGTYEEHTARIYKLKNALSELL